MTNVVENLSLEGTRIVNFLHHARINLLPESRYSRHTCGMSLAHRLLHLLRIGVHNHPCSHRHSEQRPALLEDMRKGQEVEHTVVLAHGHRPLVGLQGGIVLPVTEHDALADACRTTCI